MTDDLDLASEEAGDRDHPQKARRRQRIQAIIAVGILLIIFGVVLPQLIDYDLVWETITSLSTGQVLVLLLLGLVRIPVAAGQYASVIPGLTIRESVRSYLASNTVAEFAPPPADLAIRYGMYRAQGIEAEPAGVGIFLTGLFDNAAKLIIPVVALVVVLASGVDEVEVWELAAIGVAAIAGATILVLAALRSEEFTQRVGQRLGRFISWFLVKFNRNPLEDLGPKAVGLRELVGDTLRARWLIASIATVAGHVMSYLIMLTALRFVGVETSEVGWVELLIAYALVQLITMVGLTPGGIGVAAVGYTALLAPGQPALANLIASASLLTRVFTWLLPLAVGVIPLLAWRRNQQRVPVDERATT